MEWTNLPIVQGGAVTVLLAVLWMVFTGRLVPRQTVDDILANHADRLADKRTQISEWREAHRISEAAREKQDGALREALEVAKAAEQALSGFRAAADRLAVDREGGV